VPALVKITTRPSALMSADVDQESAVVVVDSLEWLTSWLAPAVRSKRNTSREAPLASATPATRLPAMLV